jgi:hypothetical protein
MEHLGPVLGTLLIGTFPGLFAVVGAFMAAALVLLAIRYRAGSPLRASRSNGSP